LSPIAATVIAVRFPLRQMFRQATITNVMPILP
jgi:hypothetical protein